MSHDTYKRKRVLLAGADTNLRRALEVSVELSRRGYLPVIEDGTGPYDAVLCLGAALTEITTPIYLSLDSLIACEETW